MEIEFDRAKSEANFAKHGISLDRAVDLDIVAVIEASRARDGERRFRAYGLIDRALHCLVFTMRGDVTRVISLRRAHSKEVNRYAP